MSEVTFTDFWDGIKGDVRRNLHDMGFDTQAAEDLAYRAAQLAATIGVERAAGRDTGGLEADLAVLWADFKSISTTIAADAARQTIESVVFGALRVGFALLA